MSNPTSLSIVERIYADFAAGNIAAVLAALAPDVEWIEADGSPYGGTYRGPQQVLESVFMKLGADWTGFEADAADFIGADPIIVVLGNYRARHTASGKPFEAPFAHVWRCGDGRVMAFRQFTDTALMREACGVGAAFAR